MSMNTWDTGRQALCCSDLAHEPHPVCASETTVANADLRPFERLATLQAAVAGLLKPGRSRLYLQFDLNKLIQWVHSSCKHRKNPSLIYYLLMAQLSSNSARARPLRKKQNAFYWHRWLWPFKHLTFEWKASDELFLHFYLLVFLQSQKSGIEKVTEICCVKPWHSANGEGMVYYNANTECGYRWKAGIWSLSRSWRRI